MATTILLLGITFILVLCFGALVSISHSLKRIADESCDEEDYEDD